MEFIAAVSKISEIFAWKSAYSKEILIFDILYTEIMMSLQKLGIFSFQSQFSRSNINLVVLKIIFLYEYLIRRTPFISNIFYFNHFQKKLYLVKMCPIFAGSPLFLFTKYQNFLWVCWFLCKNLTNFGYLC